MEVFYVFVLLVEVFVVLFFVFGEIMVDGMFGVGGYMCVLLVMGVYVIVFDCDLDVIVIGCVMEEVEEGFMLVVVDFFVMVVELEVCEWVLVDGVMFDIGVLLM